MRQQRRWIACAAWIGLASTRTTTTTGFVLPPSLSADFHHHRDAAPSLSLRLRIRHQQQQQQRTHGSRSNAAVLWAKKKKKEEEAKKKSDISNSEFFRSVGGFFKEERPPEPEEEKGGFFSVFRRKGEKEEPKKKTEEKDSTPWDIIRRRDKKKEPPIDTEPADEKGGFFSAFRRKSGEKDESGKKEEEKGSSPWDIIRRSEKKEESKDAKQAEPKESRSIFNKDATNRVKDAASIKSTEKEQENPTKEPKSRKEERKEQKQMKKEAAEKDNTKSSVPLSVMQKFAGSIFKSDEVVKEEWVPVFPKTRIMPGEMVPVTVGGIDLLAIASVDGRSLYCIANSCPHLGTPLETGRLTRLPVEDKSDSSSKSPPTTTTGPFGPQNPAGLILSETDVSNILSQDGCEDCIVCPLHRTAFALKSGEVRGEWCPYPPVLGAVMGKVKQPTAVAVFDIRTKGKNVEVRLNSVFPTEEQIKKDLER